MAIKIKNNFIILAVILVTIIIVGSTVTLLSWYVNKTNIRHQAELSFNSQTETINGAIATLFSRDVSVLYGLRGLFSVKPQLTRAEFYNYCAEFDLLKDYPNISSINHWSVVSPGQQADFEQKMITDASVRPAGYPDFKIFPPVPDQTQYVLDFIYPEEPNLKALGFNILSENIRRQVAETARDSGQVQASQKIYLLPDNIPGIILMAPLYQGGQVPATVEERREKISGFVTITVKVNSLMSSITNNKNVGWTKFIFQLNALSLSGKGDMNLVADSSGGAINAQTFVLNKEILFKIGASDWLAKYQGAADYDLSALEKITPLAILIIGFLLTFISATLFVFIANSRLRAVKLAQKMTIDLRNNLLKLETLTKDLEKFKLAVANASDHIIITDQDGTILFANQAVEEVTGFKPSEVVGRKVGSKYLWGGDMDKAFYEKLWRTVKIDKHRFVGEINNHRKNGEKYIAHTSISPIKDKKGNVAFFVAIERDITKEKMVDKAKSEFISLASHQLRTPLSAIKWTLEALNQDAGLTAKHKARIKDVYDSNERLIALVNDLLNVSHIEDGKIVVKKEPADLLQLINEAVKMLQMNAVKKQQTLNLSTDQTTAPANLDKTKFNEAFSNLVSNAVNYAPAGQTIGIKLSVEGNHYIVAVHNDEPIISPADKKRLFTKFSRGSNIQISNTTGSGLGLFIAKAAVEENGGKIWFESKQGQGTTFFFTVPKN